MSRRTERVNELLRERLSELVLRDLKDPRINGLITITGVEVSADLRAARVYVSVLGEQAVTETTLAGLRSASGFLHRGLEGLSLRHVPTLTFFADDSMERADRLLRLIDDTRGEAASPRSSGST